MDFPPRPPQPGPEKEETLQEKIERLNHDMAPQPDADGNLIPSFEEWMNGLGPKLTNWLNTDTSNLEILRIVYRGGVYNRPRPAALPIDAVADEYGKLLAEQTQTYQDFKDGKIPNLQDMGRGMFMERNEKIFLSNEIFESNIRRFKNIRDKVLELKTVLE